MGLQEDFSVIYGLQLKIEKFIINGLIDDLILP
jgi:hypothetical protein